MSAQSRALRDLARHYEHLANAARGDETPDPDAPPLFSDVIRGVRRVRATPIYSGSEAWQNAAEMAYRCAEERTWTHRIWHARIADWLYDGTCKALDWCSRRGHTDDNWWVRALAWLEERLGSIT